MNIFGHSYKLDINMLKFIILFFILIFTCTARAEFMPTFPPVPSDVVGQMVDGHNGADPLQEANVYIWAQDGKLYIHVIPITTSYAFVYDLSVIQNDLPRVLCFFDVTGKKVWPYAPEAFTAQTFELQICSSDDYPFDASAPLVVGYHAINGGTFSWNINPTTDKELADDYKSGVQYCQNNPVACGLYSQGDLDDKYDEGFDDGVASVDIPDCEQDFSQDDLDDKYDEGFENGVASVDIPECEEGFTQEDLGDRYDAGFEDGIASVEILECEECTDQEQSGITLTPELNMHIPLIQYSTLLGDLKLWGDFEFISGENGELLWQLVDFGEMTDK